MCPSSPAIPTDPCTTRPPEMMPPPTPVPERQQYQILHIASRPDPLLTRAAAFASFSRITCVPNRRSMSSRTGKFSNSGKLFEPTINPFSISMKPGTPIPTPRIAIRACGRAA
jgi:hypothetical protein